MSDESQPVVEQAHADDYFAKRFAPHSFVIRASRDGETVDPYAHCSYCGGITVADMLRFMQTTGVKWSASDYKYGWPHKFYVDVPCEPHQYMCSFRTGENGEKLDAQYSTRTSHHLKFYSEHLCDATAEQLDEWNEKVFPIVGVRFQKDETGRLKFAAAKGASGCFGVIV